MGWVETSDAGGTEVGGLAVDWSAVTVDCDGTAVAGAVVDDWVGAFVVDATVGSCVRAGVVGNALAVDCPLLQLLISTALNANTIGNRYIFRYICVESLLMRHHP